MHPTSRRRFLRGMAAALAAMGCALPQAASGLSAVGYSAAVNDLFSTWSPTNQTYGRNTGTMFVGLGYDWTGLLWNTDTYLNHRALLTPRHTVSAAHVSGVFANNAVFGANGLRSWSQTPSSADTGRGYLATTGYDLSVGTTAVHIGPEWGVATYPILDLGSAAAYTNYQVLLVGHGNFDPARSPRVALTPIISSTSGTLSSSYTTSQNGTQGVTLQGGDSGGPGMIGWTNPAGQLQLTTIGSHSSVSSTLLRNYDNSLGSTTAIDAMNTLMVGDGFPLRFVATPSTFWIGSGPGYTNASNWTAATPPSTNTYAGFNPATTTNREVSLSGASAAARGLVLYPAATNEGFTFTDGTLSVGRGGIANYGSATTTFATNAALVLADHQYWDARDGGLFVAGPVSLNGRLLVVQGTANTSLSGVLSGTNTGSSLSKNGSGTLHLGSEATYAGPTWIYDGTLRLGPAALLPSGTHLWLADNLSARLDLAGRTQTVARLNSIAGGDGPGRIDLGTTGRLTLLQTTGSGNSVFSGKITGATAGSDALTIQGSVTANSNTVRLGGTSDYLGITRIEGTYFYLTSLSGLGASGAGNHTLVDYRQGVATPSINILATGTLAEDLVLLATPNTTSFNTQIFNFDAPTLTNTGQITLARAATASNQAIVWDLRSTTNNQTLRLGTITGRLEPGASAGTTSRLRLTSMSTGALHVDGGISDGTIGGGGLALDFRGSGSMHLNATNSYTGTTWVNSTRLIVNVNAPHGAPGAFGSATSAISLGSFESGLAVGLYAADGVTVGRPITAGNFNAASDMFVGVENSANATFSGAITLARSLVLTAGTNSTAHFTGPISGGFPLRKAGAGTVILSASNSFAGGITVSSGTLRLDNPTGSASGTGNVDVSAGAVVRGSGSIAGALTLAANAVFEAELSATPAGQNPLLVGGILDLGPATILRIQGTPTTLPGDYTLATAATVSGSPAVLDLPAEWTAEVVPSATSLILRLTARNLIEAWRQDYFQTWENAGDASDNADPDGDQLPSLIEYALAGDPVLASSAPVPQLGRNGKFLTLTFNRTADPSLLYVVEGSDHLNEWDPVWSSTGPANIAGPVTVQDTVSSGPSRFLRLRVVQ